MQMSFPVFNDAPKFPTEGDGYLNQVFKEMDLALISQDRQGSVVVINSDVSVAEAACILGANQWCVKLMRYLGREDEPPQLMIDVIIA